MEIRHTVSRDSPQDPGKETDTYKIFIFGIYKDECDCMIGVSLVARKETGETTVQTHQDFLAARTIRKNQSVVSLMINLPTDTISIDIIDPDELLLDHKPSNYFSKLKILESKGILLEFDAELEVYRESSPENAWDKYHLKSCTVSKDGSVALKSDANPFNGKQDTETGIQYQARHQSTNAMHYYNILAQDSESFKVTDTDGDMSDYLAIGKLAAVADGLELKFNNKVLKLPLLDSVDQHPDRAEILKVARFGTFIIGRLDYKYKATAGDWNGWMPLIGTFNKSLSLFEANLYRPTLADHNSISNVGKASIAETATAASHYLHRFYTCPSGETYATNTEISQTQLTNKFDPSMYGAPSDAMIYPTSRRDLPLPENVWCERLKFNFANEGSASSGHFSMRLNGKVGLFDQVFWAITSQKTSADTQDDFYSSTQTMDLYNKKLFLDNDFNFGRQNLDWSMGQNFIIEDSSNKKCTITCPNGNMQKPVTENIQINIGKIYDTQEAPAAGETDYRTTKVVAQTGYCICPDEKRFLVANIETQAQGNMQNHPDCAGGIYIYKSQKELPIQNLSRVICYDAKNPATSEFMACPQVLPAPQYCKTNALVVMEGGHSVERCGSCYGSRDGIFRSKADWDQGSLATIWDWNAVSAVSALEPFILGGDGFCTLNCKPGYVLETDGKGSNYSIQKCVLGVCKSWLDDEKLKCLECYGKDDVANYSAWAGNSVFSRDWGFGTDAEQPFVLKDHNCDQKCDALKFWVDPTARKSPGYTSGCVPITCRQKDQQSDIYLEKEALPKQSTDDTQVDKVTFPVATLEPRKSEDWISCNFFQK